MDGIDLRDASHEQAVEAIRKAGNPVVFMVQSIINRPRVSIKNVEKDVIQSNRLNKCSTWLCLGMGYLILKFHLSYIRNKDLI